MLSEKYRRNRKCRKNRKSNGNFAKRLSNKCSKRASRCPQISQKNPKSNKNFSCNVKILRNKYGKNSKNNKFHKILHLESGKVKKGFSKSANFAKIAKVTRIFYAM